MAIRLVGVISQFEAKFTGTISDVVGFRYGQFKGQFTVAITDQVGS